MVDRRTRTGVRSIWCRYPHHRVRCSGRCTVSVPTRRTDRLLAGRSGTGPSFCGPFERGQTRLRHHGVRSNSRESVPRSRIRNTISPSNFTAISIVSGVVGLVRPPFIAAITEPTPPCPLFFGRGRSSPSESRSETRTIRCLQKVRIGSFVDSAEMSTRTSVFGVERASTERMGVSRSWLSSLEASSSPPHPLHHVRCSGAASGGGGRASEPPRFTRFYRIRAREYGAPVQ